jgi:hypothetical protein
MASIHSLGRSAILRICGGPPVARSIGLRTFTGPLLLASTEAAAAYPFSRWPISSAFHNSSRNCILPPGPQVVDGTANDPAPVPRPSPTHGSYHWTFERALSVGLIPLTIAPFAAGSIHPVLDAVLVATILLHSHIGFSYV